MGLRLDDFQRRNTPNTIRAALIGHMLGNSMAHLRAYEVTAAEAFVKLLLEHKLLVQRELHINLPGQPPSSLTGFHVVDGEPCPRRSWATGTAGASWRSSTRT